MLPVRSAQFGELSVYAMVAAWLSSARRTLDDDRTRAYGAMSLFDAACVQAPSERGAGRDADVRGSPRLPNSSSHQALHRPRQ